VGEKEKSGKGGIDAKPAHLRPTQRFCKTNTEKWMTCEDCSVKKGGQKVEGDDGGITLLTLTVDADPR